MRSTSTTPPTTNQTGFTQKELVLLCVVSVDVEEEEEDGWLEDVEEDGWLEDVDWLEDVGCDWARAAVAAMVTTLAGGWAGALVATKPANATTRSRGTTKLCLRKMGLLSSAAGQRAAALVVKSKTRAISASAAQRPPGRRHATQAAAAQDQVCPIGISIALRSTGRGTFQGS